MMRTTVSIDDELLAILKEQARRENVSLTALVNRTLRAGIGPPGRLKRARPRYREDVRSMGTPKLALDKALPLAEALEDAEAAGKRALRK